METNQIQVDIADNGGQIKTGHFCFTPEELSAPDATCPNTLFNWQSQEPAETILARFGGLANIAASLGTDLEKGLTTEQVNDPERIIKYGSNKPEIVKGETYCGIIWEGLQEFTLIVLIVAAIISTITGILTEGWSTGWIDGIAIIIAVILILNIEAINDLQKDKQFRELNKINSKKTIKVIRDGNIQELLTDNIVIGDVLYITSGDTIPCDLIYINGNNVIIDESKLTGESEQIKKNINKPFIVSSSECHDGSFYGLVIAIGPYSVYGKMKLLIEMGNDESTPLQKKLTKLTTQITKFAAFIGIVTILILIIVHLIEYFTSNGTIDNNGKPKWTPANWELIVSYFMAGITILVVAIPVGLPLAVTIALAYSVKRMMKDNNLVRHLSACVTMGCANTICSDKTGTLTLGHMTVMQGWILNDTIDDQTIFLNKFIKLDNNERIEFINNFNNIPNDLLLNIIENCNLNNEAFLISNTENSTEGNNNNNNNKKNKGNNKDNNNNNAPNNNIIERGNGNSLDIALIRFTKELNKEYDYNIMRNKYPIYNNNININNNNNNNYGDNDTYIVKKYPFNSNRKRSSTLVHLNNGKYRLYVKGAAEIIIRLSDNVISINNTYKRLTGSFIEDSEGKVQGEGSRYNIIDQCLIPMAKTGLRVIALAYKDIDNINNIDDLDKTIEYKLEEQKGNGPCPLIESGLTLISLIGVQDPPRPEVPAAVKECQKAGIFVRMVTGDNLETAKEIATQVNIYQESGYINGQGIKYPPGRCITGPQFRELVGGLVLPPHFNHICTCKDLSSDPAYKEGYISPKYPIHYGYPSIVGHISNECQYWLNNNINCNDECKQRGCYKQLTNNNNNNNKDNNIQGNNNNKYKSEIQKYYVIKNQYIFESYINTLQVMARSTPSDKHMLVSGLMERRLIVAVTGDGTNDGPALSKSNVGFAMGISGTSIAKDASDIILMDDNFTSIVKSLMWGRNVYDSIRKFLQFQVTINLVACSITFISAIIIKESPIKPIQMLWLDLIMDTFAALALATEYPTKELLNKQPYDNDEPVITNIMLRNILGQYYYQFIIMLVLTLYGNIILDVPVGSHLSTTAIPTVHLTIVFNTFVILQVFNEFNCRKINNEINIFKYILNNKTFIFIIIFIIIIQILFVTFGGNALNCARLNVIEHIICIIYGIISWPAQLLIRLVPYHWFYDIGREESSSTSKLDFLIRYHSSLRQQSLSRSSKSSTIQVPSNTIKRLFSE